METVREEKRCGGDAVHGGCGGDEGDGGAIVAMAVEIEGFRGERNEGLEGFPVAIAAVMISGTVVTGEETITIHGEEEEGDIVEEKEVLKSAFVACFVVFSSFVCVVLPWNPSLVCSSLSFQQCINRRKRFLTKRDLCERMWWCETVVERKKERNAEMLGDMEIPTGLPVEWWYRRLLMVILMVVVGGTVSLSIPPPPCVVPSISLFLFVLLVLTLP